MSVDSHRGPVDPLHRTARFYRAHLQEALAQHVDPSRIHLSKAFQDVTFNTETNKLEVTFIDGTTAAADILLGADGIHSAVRTAFVPESRTTRTGWVAFRSVFPQSHVSHIADLPDEATHIWGPDRTLFISKLGRGMFTVVGSVQADPADASSPYHAAEWDAAGSVEALRALYTGWSPLWRAVVDATPHTRLYPNASAQQLDTWVLGGGRVTLAGDAAHAHGGAFAAGGSLALDDAWAFAAVVTTVFPETATTTTVPTAAKIAAALRLYERTRKAHTDRVMRAVQLGNKKKAARAVTAPESDEELRARMEAREDPAWIHEHDVQAVFLKAVDGEFGVWDSQARL